jgi:hypothetical protein
MTTPILNSKNGHYYEFVAANTSWSLALQEAAGKSYKGMAGYLVTITSSDEQQFVGTYLNSFGLASPSYFWAGGSDKDSEGIWKWVSGPESGKLISSGYANWFPGGVGYAAQPNGTLVQTIRDEDGLALDSLWNYQWADLPTGDPGFQSGELVKGYLVEYGGMPATYRITKSATSVNEGSAITFSIYTNNVEWNSYLSYSLTGIAKSDLSSGELSGTAQVLVNGSEGLASITLNLAEDYFTDGPETLTLNVSGTTSSVVVLDTSKTPNYTISSSATSYNEGTTAVFSISATGIPAGLIAQYSVSGVNASDITGGLSGSVTFAADGTSSLSIPLLADGLTEGTETLTLLIGSAKLAVTINDTSKTPTYLITSTALSYNEGTSASFTLSTTNLAAGTLVPYTLTGISSSDTSAALTGNLTLGSDGKATLLVPLIADSLTEGTEVLVLTAGGSAKSVQVIDTSLAPTYVITPASTSYNEGSTASFRLTTTSLTAGTVVNYIISGVSSDDISTSLTGTLTLGSDTSATLSIPLVSDNLLEGNETLSVAIASASASVVIVDSSKAPTFTLTSTQAAFNEGATATFRLSTTNVAEGYILPYTITGVSEDDLVYGTSGSLRVGNTGVSLIAIPLKKDMLTEGAETLVLSIAGLTGSTVVNDTSLSPSFRITPTSGSYNEGESAVFSIAATNAEAGTSASYVLSGVTSQDIGVALTGNLIIGASGVTTLNVPLLADLFTEGSETLRLTLAPNAPLSVASSAVSINDTSRTPTFLISTSTPTYDEGSTVVFRIQASQVAPGLALLYTFSGLSREDFTGASSGSLTVDSTGFASLSLNLTADATTEGPESLTLSIGSSNYTVLVNDTSKAPVFSISSALPSYNEGSTAVFTVNALNVSPGIAVAYTLSGLGGLNGADYEGASSGTLTLGQDNKAVLSVPINADNLTEGAETLTLTVAGVSQSVLINDSSNQITYSVASSASSINEGETVRFTITTVDLPAGTKISYTLSGLAQEDLVGFVSTDPSSLSGVATVNALGLAEVNIGLAQDQLTEGAETLTLRLNALVPGTGLINSSSASVLINDSSLTPVIPVQPPPEKPTDVVTEDKVTQDKVTEDKVTQDKVSLASNAADVFSWLPSTTKSEFNGLGGTDTLKVSGLLKDFEVSAADSSAQASASLSTSAKLTEAKTNFTANLQNIERLVFSDMSLALDTQATDSAGKAALIAGAVFGPTFVKDTQVLGALISLLDANQMTDAQVASFALGVMLGETASNKSVVDLLYKNLTGAMPSAAVEANYVNMIEGGIYTPSSLALFAANHELNKTNISFVGIAEFGLIYLPI